MRTIPPKYKKPNQISEYRPSATIVRFLKPLKSLGYRVTQQLGHGSEGVVFLAYNERNQKQVAIKACDRKKCPRNAIGEFWLWAYVDHPHCLKIQEKFTFKRIVYYVMQYTPNMTILDWVQDVWYSGKVLNDDNKPDEEIIKKWCRQFLTGIQYLHNKGFFHLDIKPDNIFLDEHWDVKLGDFGFMRTRNDKSEPLILGCPAYMPPEGLVSNPSMSLDLAKVDIWSTGVTMFEMITGKLLSGKNFKICGQKRSMLMQNLRENHPRASAMDTMYIGGHDLVLHMIQWDPEDRVSATEGLKHPWLRMASGCAHSHQDELNHYGSSSIFRSIVGCATNKFGRPAMCLIRNPASKMAVQLCSILQPSGKRVRWESTQYTTSDSSFHRSTARKKPNLAQNNFKRMKDNLLTNVNVHLKKRKLNTQADFPTAKRFKPNKIE